MLHLDGCSNLININMPKNLNYLYGAFGNCTSLQNLYIPANVIEIGSNAFENCYNLTGITIDPNNQYYEMEDGIIYAKDNSTLIMTAAVQNEIEITIREGIKELGGTSLSMCYNAITVNLPRSLTYITGRAFSGLEKLENIYFKNGNEIYQSKDGYLYGYSEDLGKILVYIVPTKMEIKIDEDTNYISNASIQNNNISKLVIPDSVTTIENQIIEGGNNLKLIEIGKGVSNLYSNFKAWSGAQSVEVIIDEDNPYYKVEGNLILTKDGKEVVTFLKDVKSQTIPNGVEAIQDSAFLNFGVTEIILPNTLLYIGSKVFESTTITTITIPNSVKSIANNAFEACPTLEEIRVDTVRNGIVGSPWGVPKGDRAIIWLK